MFITFKETHYMSENGHIPRLFQTGKSYDVAQSAACEALQKGWAVVTPSDRILTNPQTFKDTGGSI